MRGLARIRRLARGIRTPRQDRALILCYHRVIRLERDPWSICVTPENFDAHLAILAHSQRAISLSEMFNRLSIGSSLDRSVVVTFDDGYADNLHAALPALERHGIPATFFITTGCIGRGTEFWSDEIERRPGSIEEWRARLLPLDAAARDAALAPLPLARDSHRTLTRDELLTLARSPLVEIGAHTVDHLLLPAHSHAIQRADIAESRRWLEETLARPVPHFSYPYGERSADTERIAAEIGFQSAVTCDSRYIARDSAAMALPRYFVPNLPGDQFAARLADWLR